MVFLAAAATVIASQAVITGAFSVTQQAAQLGYLPRLRIAHTSETRMGQIYVPWVNWALLASVLTLVVNMDQANVPALIPLIRQASIERPLDDGDLSYFLSTIALRRGNAPGMSQWRKRLFLATSQITADAAEYFQLPREHTVIMGSHIEL